MTKINQPVSPLDAFVNGVVCLSADALWEHWFEHWTPAQKEQFSRTATRCNASHILCCLTTGDLEALRRYQNLRETLSDRWMAHRLGFMQGGKFVATPEDLIEWWKGCEDADKDWFQRLCDDLGMPTLPGLVDSDKASDVKYLLSNKGQEEYRHLRMVDEAESWARAIGILSHGEYTTTANDLITRWGTWDGYGQAMFSALCDSENVDGLPTHLEEENVDGVLECLGEMQRSRTAGALESVSAGVAPSAEDPSA